MTTLFLAGSTGLVGSQALALLLADERVTRVVAPTRRPIAAHAKLLNPEMDSANLQPDADWWSVDGAICALGTTRAQAKSAAAYFAIDHDYALAVATQLGSRGVSRFALTSALGANARSVFVYPRTKGMLENAVRRIGFQSLTLVRPGFIGGDRVEHRPMERFMGSLLCLISPILPASARISPASTVAAILVEAAIDGGPGTHIISSAEIANASSRKGR